MAIVDVVHNELAFGVGKIKLLADGVVLIYIPGCLNPHVQLIPIKRVGDCIAQMFHLVDPGQISPTKFQTW